MDQFVFSLTLFWDIVLHEFIQIELDLLVTTRKSAILNCVYKFLNHRNPNKWSIIHCSFTSSGLYLEQKV